MSPRDFGEGFAVDVRIGVDDWRTIARGFRSWDAAHAWLSNKGRGLGRHRVRRYPAHDIPIKSSWRSEFQWRKAFA